MGNTIIIAGGGHGGIALGYQLAKRGYEVTVYEKHSRDNMGYDWTDIFDKKVCSRPKWSCLRPTNSVLSRT